MDANRQSLTFDFRELLSAARRKIGNEVGGLTIRLPFVSVNVRPHDVEQQIAREIVIELADRRGAERERML